jgi:hypothetical protein
MFCIPLSLARSENGSEENQQLLRFYLGFRISKSSVILIVERYEHTKIWPVLFS